MNINIETDPYLQHGIEIPVVNDALKLEPLHDRIDRVLKAIRNDQTSRASASIGYLSHEGGEHHAEGVWLSTIMNLKQHGVEEIENEFEYLSIAHAGAIDLYDPESDRMLRVTEYVGPLVAGTVFFDQVSNFAILSERESVIKEYSQQLTLAD